MPEVGLSAAAAGAGGFLLGMLLSIAGTPPQSYDTGVAG